MTIDELYPTNPQADGTLGAQLVRSLFERHEVPKHKQAAALAEILELSYSQASRRLSTNASWAVEDFQALAAHYGETLTEFVSMSHLDEMVSAALTIGTTTVPCRLLHGSPLHKPRIGALVATRIDASWFVLPADHNLATQAYDIKRIVIEPSSAISRRIAVLDDHPESARLIASYLESTGFEAVPFTSLDSLAAASATDQFDGYILDWLIGNDALNDTARDLVAVIRSRDAHCPIIILTGQMHTGAVNEADIATAMVKYRLKLFEKPIRLPIIVASLMGSLAPA